MSRDYGNIRVNIVHPSTRLDYTALGIYNALAATGWAYTFDVQASVLAVGGDWGESTKACRGLKNGGILVTNENHGANTVYYMHPIEADALAFKDTVNHKLFSELKGIARGATQEVRNGTGSPKMLRELTAFLVSFGTHLNPPLDAAEVLMELEPI